MKEKQTVLLDTNSLMAISEFKLDLFSALRESLDFPFQVAVLRGTLLELEKIKKEQRGKYRFAAKLAEQLLASQAVQVIEEKGNVDDILAEHSRNGDLVLTQDIGLKRRLQKPYLTIRQKKKIAMLV